MKVHDRVNGWTLCQWVHIRWKHVGQNDAGQVYGSIASDNLSQTADCKMLAWSALAEPNHPGRMLGRFTPGSFLRLSSTLTTKT